MLRGVWQALNCLFIHATYCVIVTGSSPGETKMWAAVRENGDFFALAVRITGKLLEDRWVHVARGLTSIELSFHPCNILHDNRRGVSRRNKNVGCGTWKRQFFCTCGSNNWETVQDRWVYAARGLASTKLSFHSCNVLRDCHRGVPRANKKWRPGYVKMTIFCNCGSNNWETVVDRLLTH